MDFMVLRLAPAIKVGNECSDAFLRWGDEINTSEVRRGLAWYCNVVNNCTKGIEKIESEINQNFKSQRKNKMNDAASVDQVINLIEPLREIP